MLAKIIAGLMTKQIMLEAANDKSEDTIKLTKKPGKKKANAMEVLVQFNCKPDRIPVYMVKLVETAAGATEVSFDDMLEYIKTCHEIMQEISTEQTKEVRK